MVQDNPPIAPSQPGGYDPSPAAPTPAPTQATQVPVTVQIEDDRTSSSAAGIRRAFLDHLRYTIGKDESQATAHDRFMALALLVRDRITARWIPTQEAHDKADAKRVYYLSAEFLLGRALRNNLHNLGLYETAEQVMAELQHPLSDLLEQERDAGLGNGGLGRLAACFLDSLATLEIPAYGYGIRYEFGIFDQVIRQGAQIERPEEWLRMGNPWLLPRADLAQHVHFFGRTETINQNGQPRVRWVETKGVLGVPHDMPIAGYRNGTVNTLRLWSARASEEFDLAVFNAGDYERAVFDKNNSESISKVLYPNDLLIVGKELRLKQQYFFVACSIADLLKRHLQSCSLRDSRALQERLRQLPDKAAIQLNDTHPTIAIPELMRLLVDEYGLEWELAWEITEASFAYTNHTLLPEALEQWSVDLMGRLLPRHLQIIFEINHRFLRQVWTFAPNEPDRLSRMSLIQEGPHKTVRMAYLATLGSHKVNGVAALHSQLLRETLLPEFAELYPERFENVTNGVTPRRWLVQANPELSTAISRRIGDSWPTHLEELEKLLPMARDPEFAAEILAIKRRNKERLCEYIRRHYSSVALDPRALFDVQIKRLHEYKRQLLNILYLIALYQKLKHSPVTQAGSGGTVARVALFGAKAAPGYTRAKLIIRLINAVADVVNKDPRIGGRLKILFVPNYRVSLAELIIPAADLSQQISTAGFEASGTGNMKLAMNGALTIGTLDGANIEIRDAVGHENFFLFGLTAEEVRQKKASYNPWECYRQSESLRGAIDLIRSGFFSYDEPSRFAPLLDSLLPPEEHPGHGDPFLVLADFDAYCACQDRVDQAYREPTRWAEMAIHNIARTGMFSSDRSIREYAEKIWNVQPLPSKPAT